MKKMPWERKCPKCGQSIRLIVEEMSGGGHMFFFKDGKYIDTFLQYPNTPIRYYAQCELGHKWTMRNVDVSVFQFSDFEEN